MTSPPPANSRESARDGATNAWRARADRLGRARLSLPRAVLGMALLVLLGTVVGLTISRAVRTDAPPPSEPELTAPPPAAAASLSGESTPLPAADPSGGPTPTLIVARPAPLPTGLPTPFTRAGTAAFGTLELGGQVEHDLRHAERMREAGMSWVRVELAWSANQSPVQAQRAIQQAHGLGFKVLLTVTGAQRHPVSISYPAYLDFLSRVAAYGPDAIEVWSEPNTSLHWPREQLDGGLYTRRMLAPAYNAIKRVDANIIVISGALNTSESMVREVSFLEQMAAAGARNYLDCAGVRYTEGAQPPAAGGELQAIIQRYGDAFNRPVCFVALGYLSAEGYGSLPAEYAWAEDITAARQAEWLAEAAGLSHDSGRVRLLVVWNVDYLTWTDVEPGAGYAIIRPDGSCPACALLPQRLPE